MTSSIQDLGPVVGDNDDYDEDIAFPTEPEKELSTEDVDFVERMVALLTTFSNKLGEDELYPYQSGFAERCFESMILNDGAKLTGLWSRQSGKTQTMAYVIATIMILFPKFAVMFPKWFGQYKRGVLVGSFAPTESQAETLFQRVQLVLSTDQARAILEDPEINDTVAVAGKVITLVNSGSICRMQTANPKAQVESKTYHFVVIDESQGADDVMVKKSIEPMLASTSGTMVFTGTPSNKKNFFYEQIQLNKRNDVRRTGGSKDHHQHDWKSCARYNPRYKKYVMKTMTEMGADSDEFLLSYALKWLLERGMFTTSERLDALGDTSMQRLVTQHYSSPIVLGVDPARKQDSTVVTAVWVDWDNPDEFGYYDHRVLNWLEIHGERWEDQYAAIVDFASNYNVLAVAVDGSGVGDVVGERLGLLMPRSQVICLSSNVPDQSARWKHMTELMARGLVAWPAGSQVRKKRVFRRFYQQMEDLEKDWRGPNLLAAAPNAANAHDDYPDSLALALYLTKSVTMPEVEQGVNPFYR